MNCSCTSQVPFQEIISISVCEATYFAKKSSGKNITFFTPKDCTIFTALAEVQHTSVSAFTSADVKAETDLCCTSANAVKIVNSLGVKKVIFLPDDYLAKYVASQTDVEIISWKGTCEVHEQFNDKEINEIRKNNPGIKVIAHPECPPDVIKASDFAGSTSGMIKYVRDNQPEKVMMVTECSMSDNVQIDNPKVEFIRPCNLCPHMKKITLPKILDCLENETNELIMNKETIEKARKSVERMAEIGR